MSVIKGNHAGLGGAGAPGGALSGFYSYTIDQSVRFNDDDDPRLSRTWGAAATDDTTWTVSMWVKRANQDGGGWHTLFAEESEAWTVCAFYNDTIYIQINAGGAAHYIQTNRLFRDFSSWYHIVVAFDEDNGTAAHRLRLYINGVEETSFATDQRSSISSSSNSNWNTNGKSCAIGARSASNNSLNFDGYMAEFHNIDGQQLTPSSFGETKDGVWVPKAYSGSHGDNGFYLPFDDSSAIGDDESANTNDWTVANLAATDVVPDSPTNNFCTLNPLTHGTYPTLSEGNLKIASVYGSDLSGVASTWFPTTGKWYWEVHNEGAASTYPYLGITDQAKVLTSATAGSYYSVAWLRTGGSAAQTGTNTFMGTITKNDVTSWTNDDITMFALDVDARKLWIGKNGTWDSSGDPAGGSGEDASWTVDTGVSPSFMGYSGQGLNSVFNFGQDGTFAGNQTAQGNADGNGVGNFYYSPPSGFLAMATSNIDDPTIGPGQSSQADDHFNTVLYSGNGSTQSITGVGFQPDWTWIKNRAATDAHALTDSVRGVTKEIQTNALSAESTNADGLTAFGDDGFSLGDDDIYNTNAEGYVSWNWKGGGSASTNTDGSGIDSSVSANATAGISILTYTGTGNTSHTIGHGLGKTPAFVMSKSRDTGSGGGSYWFIKWNGQTSNNNLLLNFTDAQTNIATNYAGGGWSDFDSSNTTTIVPRIGYTGSSVDSVNKSGEDYVAYVFAQVEGFSSIGSFIGNGNDNGIFVYTGFRPAWLWIKRIDAANDWHMMDDHRNPINVMDGLLFANLTNAESSDASYNRDFLSNGFKIRGSEAYVNASGGTFVYMAFAHSPFKFANAF